MGITQLITQFYRDLSKDSFRKEPMVGQVCWAPSLHINKVPMVIEVERADPKEAFAAKIKLRNL